MYPFVRLFPGGKVFDPCDPSLIKKPQYILNGTGLPFKYSLSSFDFGRENYTEILIPTAESTPYAVTGSYEWTIFVAFEYSSFLSSIEADGFAGILVMSDAGEGVFVSERDEGFDLTINFKTGFSDPVLYSYHIRGSDVINTEGMTTLQITNYYNPGPNEEPRIYANGRYVDLEKIGVTRFVTDNALTEPMKACLFGPDEKIKIRGRIGTYVNGKSWEFPSAFDGSLFIAAAVDGTAIEDPSHFGDFCPETEIYTPKVPDMSAWGNKSFYFYGGEDLTKSSVRLEARQSLRADIPNYFPAPEGKEALALFAFGDKKPVRLHVRKPDDTIATMAISEIGEEAAASNTGISLTPDKKSFIVDSAPELNWEGAQTAVIPSDWDMGIQAVNVPVDITGGKIYCQLGAKPDWFLLSEIDPATGGTAANKATLFWSKDMLRGERAILGGERIFSTVPAVNHLVEDGNNLEIAPHVKDKMAGWEHRTIDLYDRRLSLALPGGDSDIYTWICMAPTNLAQDARGIPYVYIMGPNYGWGQITGPGMFGEAFDNTLSAFQINIVDSDVAVYNDESHVFLSMKDNLGAISSKIICATMNDSGEFIHKFSETRTAENIVASCIYNYGGGLAAVYLHHNTANTTTSSVKISAYPSIHSGLSNIEFDGGFHKSISFKQNQVIGGIQGWASGIKQYIAITTGWAKNSPDSTFNRIYLYELDFVAGSTREVSVTDVLPSVTWQTKRDDLMSCLWSSPLRKLEMNGEVYLGLGLNGVGDAYGDSLRIYRFDPVTEKLVLDFTYVVTGRLDGVVDDLCFFRHGDANYCAAVINQTVSKNVSIRLFEKPDGGHWKLVQRIEGILSGAPTADTGPCSISAGNNGTVTAVSMTGPNEATNLGMHFVFDPFAGMLRRDDPGRTWTGDPSFSTVNNQELSYKVIDTAMFNNGSEVAGLVGINTEHFSATSPNFKILSRNNLNSANLLDLNGCDYVLTSCDHAGTSSFALNALSGESGHTAEVAQFEGAAPGTISVMSWHKEAGRTFVIGVYHTGSNTDLPKDMKTVIYELHSDGTVEKLLLTNVFDARRIDKFEYKGESFYVLQGENTWYVCKFDISSPTYLVAIQEVTDNDGFYGDSFSYAIDDDGSLIYGFYRNGLKIFRTNDLHGSITQMTVPGSWFGHGVFDIHVDNGIYKLMLVGRSGSKYPKFIAWERFDTIMVEKSSSKMKYQFSRVSISGGCYADNGDYHLFAVNSNGIKGRTYVWSPGEDSPHAGAEIDSPNGEYAQFFVHKGECYFSLPIYNPDMSAVSTSFYRFSRKDRVWTNLGSAKPSSSIILEHLTNGGQSWISWPGESNSHKASHLSSYTQGLNKLNRYQTQGGATFVDPHLPTFGTNSVITNAYNHVLGMGNISPSQGFYENRAPAYQYLDVYHNDVMEELGYEKLMDKYATFVPQGFPDKTATPDNDVGQVRRGLFKNNNRTLTVRAYGPSPDPVSAMINYPFPAAEERTSGKLYFELTLDKHIDITAPVYPVIQIGGSKTLLKADSIVIAPNMPAGSLNQTVYKGGDVLGFLFNYETDTFTFYVNGVADPGLTDYSFVSLGRPIIGVIDRAERDNSTVRRDGGIWLNAGQDNYNYPPFPDVIPLRAEDTLDLYTITRPQDFVKTYRFEGETNPEVIVDIGMGENGPDFFFVVNKDDAGATFWSKKLGGDRCFDLSRLLGTSPVLANLASPAMDIDNSGNIVFNNTVDINGKNVGLSGQKYGITAFKASPCAGIDYKVYTGSGDLTKVIPSNIEGTCDACIIIHPGDPAVGGGLKTFFKDYTSGTYVNNGSHANIPTGFEFQDGAIQVTNNGSAQLNMQGVEYHIIMFKNIYGFSYYGNLSPHSDSRGGFIPMGFSPMAGIFYRDSNLEGRVLGGSFSPRDEYNSFNLMGGLNTRTFIERSFQYWAVRPAEGGYRIHNDRIHISNAGMADGHGFAFCWASAPWGFGRGTY